ncbi:MAG: hypothetical protein ACRDGV_04610 [Candidatus Limnocylindria bacterium]
MPRSTITVVVVIVGLLLLADFLVLNPTLGAVAGVAIDLSILVAAGAGLAGVAALAARRGTDLWRRADDPLAGLLVLIGILAMLVAGLWPGSTGARDPAVHWLVVALLLPLAATLFGLLFVTTLAAGRRSLTSGGRDATLMIVAATLVVLLLLPIGGAAGGWLATAASWALEVPIGAVFRGILIGVAVLGATLAARTLLGIGPTDE